MFKNILSLLLISSLTVVNATTVEKEEKLISMLTDIPNIEEGQKIFTICSKCHGIEGWGSSNGDFPQLAGQHQSVILKQLHDIRLGKRDNAIMLPVILELTSQGEQAIINVAAYIETLKMDPDPEVGEADDEMLKIAKIIYTEKCTSCHGSNGEGLAEKYYPLLQGQNYTYLLRQLKHIKSGKRKNANREMQKVISQMSLSELDHLADFISRLEPPENKIAP